MWTTTEYLFSVSSPGCPRGHVQEVNEKSGSAQETELTQGGGTGLVSWLVAAVVLGALDRAGQEGTALRAESWTIITQKRDEQERRRRRRRASRKWCEGQGKRGGLLPAPLSLPKSSNGRE